MGWPTKYSKAQIAEALENADQSRVVNNGWERLSSSISDPTDLGVLITPGNYITSYWTDGPSLDNDISHLNISITVIDGETYQYINAAEKKFYRILTSGSEIYGNWNIPAAEGAINPGPTAPSNPIDAKTIWMDTLDPNAPSLKVYISGSWKEIIPSGSLKAEIYDPTNKHTDIFKFIDDAIINASLDVIANAFKTHINDNDIHTSVSEKTNWNNTPTETDIDNSVSVMKTMMGAIVENLVDTNVNKVNTLLNEINGLNVDITSHSDATNLHPSTAKQTEWDNKSDAIHQHKLDGRVVVDADHIEGVVPSTLLPYNVKERVYIVGSLVEMHQLTRNPIHNGDLICVESGNNQSWYFVINDTYLGTTSAANAFKEINSTDGTIDWDTVLEKPTTLEGFRITDSATKSDMNNIDSGLTQVEANIIGHDYSSAAANKTFYENALAELRALEAQLPSALDASIVKLEEIAGI